MSATFDPRLLTDRDRARQRLGDVHDSGVAGPIASPMLSDVQIDAVIGSVGFTRGVAQLARDLATRFAAFPDELDESGGVKVRWTERVRRWERLAAEMERVSDAGGPGVMSVHVGQVACPEAAELR